ncbi:MAG: helix-turn-helix domain-containing protein [Acutalibacteraceae bacterium]|jgi:putative transcriptional regulator
MDISYKRLRNLPNDRDMKKKDLERAAGISNYVVSKMTGNENITVETVEKNCKALNCTLNDMMEFVSDSE